jgi:hypothetical protein
VSYTRILVINVQKTRVIKLEMARSEIKILTAARHLTPNSFGQNIICKEDNFITFHKVGSSYKFTGYTI